MMDGNIERPQSHEIVVQTIPYGIRCRMCGVEKKFYITKNQARLLALPKQERPFIQHILPDMPPQDREMFISCTCPDCWNNLFGEG